MQLPHTMMIGGQPADFGIGHHLLSPDTNRAGKILVIPLLKQGHVDADMARRKTWVFPGPGKEPRERFNLHTFLFAKGSEYRRDGNNTLLQSLWMVTVRISAAAAACLGKYSKGF
jgi:hypothetical protein